MLCSCQYAAGIGIADFFANAGGKLTEIVMLSCREAVCRCLPDVTSSRLDETAESQVFLDDDI
jgi:hypothetical protein